MLKVREADLALLKEVAEPARSKFQQVCGASAWVQRSKRWGARGGGRSAPMRAQGAPPLLGMSGLDVIRASRQTSLLASWKKHCVTLPADTGGGMGRVGV